MLPLFTVLKGLDEITRCILALAGPPTVGNSLIYCRREIGDWCIPTVGFASKSGRSLCLQVNAEIINSVKDTETGKAKLLDWKRRLSHKVNSIRGDDPWRDSDEYAVSLAFRFHPGHHGGTRHNLDVENYIKPIIDAVAAGLFCDNQTDPLTMNSWNFDDSNFNTLLIQRLPDTSNPEAEGIAVYISAR